MAERVEPMAKTVAKKKTATKKAAPKTSAKPKLLSGGNPQIAKAYGDAPVQAYIAAMPDWKRDVGKRIDAIITKAVPGVKKAVKWNTPMYGKIANLWFLSFHVFARYVKVTFFAGTRLTPLPPGGTPRSKEARWIDIYENDKVDSPEMKQWIRQSSKLPGWKTGKDD